MAIGPSMAFAPIKSEFFFVASLPSVTTKIYCTKGVAAQTIGRNRFGTEWLSERARQRKKNAPAHGAWVGVVAAQSDTRSATTKEYSASLHAARKSSAYAFILTCLCTMVNYTKSQRSSSSFSFVVCIGTIVHGVER